MFQCQLSRDLVAWYVATVATLMDVANLGDNLTDSVEEPPLIVPQSTWYLASSQFTVFRFLDYPSILQFQKRACITSENSSNKGL